MEEEYLTSRNPDVFVDKSKNHNYDIDKISAVIFKGLDTVFGKNYFKKNETILIKPNLLIPAEPEEAITTHPNVIISIAKILRQKGCKVYVADNPAGFSSLKSVSEIYEILGLMPYNKKLFELLFNNKPPVKKGGFSVSWWAVEFDKIINLAKLKTHELMKITAATKNIYGLIPGLSKSQFHRNHPRPEDFGKVVIDLYDAFKPEINILEGLVSLEGNGPGKRGIKKERGLLMVSSDALKLDQVLNTLIDKPEVQIPHLQEAFKRGLLNPREIKVSPEDIQPLKIEDFIFPFSKHISNRVPEFLLPALKPLFNYKLAVKNKSCLKCKRCINICPRNAISMNSKGKVVINNKKCILCMCCRETCITGCIEIKYNPIYEIIKKFI